jgi:hypothetical protein
MKNLTNTTILGLKNLSKELLKIYTTLDLRIQGDSYVGDWEDGKFHGYGTYTWADRSYYVGEFKDGKKDGEGKMEYDNGYRYEGKWKDDKFHGQGTFECKDGSKYDGDWKDNLWSFLENLNN